MKHTVTITRREQVEIDITVLEALELLDRELTNRLNAELASLKVLSPHDLPADEYVIRNAVLPHDKRQPQLWGQGGRKPRDWSFRVCWGEAEWLRKFQLIDSLRAALQLK